MLRYDMRGRFRKRRSQLAAIYAGVRNRTLLEIDWKSQSAIDVFLGARYVRVNQDRRRSLKPLGPAAGDDLRALVEQITAATESEQ